MDFSTLRPPQSTDLKGRSTMPAPAPGTGPEKVQPGPAVDRRRLWLAAIKPPMYTVAVVPIWVGTALGAIAAEAVDWGRFGLLLGAAIAIIAWENLTNDVFDAATGIDVNKAHSVVNLTGRRDLVFWIANGFLGAAIAAIALLCWGQGDPTVLVLLLVACFGGYLYQGPPFRLGYLGLGEVICFVTFGPLGVLAAAYGQTGAWVVPVGGAIAASSFVGITTSLILFCSHFHQVADDLAAGKRSPVVRLGTRRSAELLPWLCVLAFGPVGVAAIAGALPVWTLLCGLSLPWAVQLCRHVGVHHDQPAAVSNSKFIAVALHFWSGLLFGLGLLLPLWGI